MCRRRRSRRHRRKYLFNCWYISSALFGVPAVKGVEFGAGFDFAKMTGYEANDTYSISNGNVKINKNNNGGVLGGMTTGAPIIVRAVVKPTPSISKAQKALICKNDRGGACYSRQARPLHCSQGSTCC